MLSMPTMWEWNWRPRPLACWIELASWAVDSFTAPVFENVKLLGNHGLQDIGDDVLTLLQEAVLSMVGSTCRISVSTSDMSIFENRPPIKSVILSVSMWDA